MRNRLAELGADRLRVGVMAVAGHPIRNRPGYRFRRPKQCLGGQVASLAQHDIHQGTVSIDRAIEIAPVAADLDVCLVYIPARRQLAAPALLTEFVRKDR